MDRDSPSTLDLWPSQANAWSVGESDKQRCAYSTSPNSERVALSRDVVRTTTTPGSFRVFFYF